MLVNLLAYLQINCLSKGPLLLLRYLLPSFENSNHQAEPTDNLWDYLSSFDILYHSRGTIVVFIGPWGLLAIFRDHQSYLGTSCHVSKWCHDQSAVEELEQD
jgi:hypothetical protein